MTFGDLKLMLAQDVNRADKETVWYPIWINRAIRRIQVLATIKQGRWVYRSPQWGGSAAGQREPVAHQDAAAVPEAGAQGRPAEKSR